MSNDVIRSRHGLKHCGLCKVDAVICADCGNNCCNGGTLETADGKRCGCDEAYAHQKVYHRDNDSIVFANVDTQHKPSTG